MTKDMDDVNNGWHQPERLKAYEPRPKPSTQPKPSLHRAIYEPTEERPETDSEHMARDMREGTFPARSERKMVPVTPPEPDLLPCPFCGSAAVLSRSPRAVVVGCDNDDCPSRECYSSGQIKNEPRVIERWNTRAQPAPAADLGFGGPEDVDRAKSALADLVSWFGKPVQGALGMVWVIPAGDQGADDAIAAARSIVGGESS